MKFTDGYSLNRSGFTPEGRPPAPPRELDPTLVVCPLEVSVLTQNGSGSGFVKLMGGLIAAKVDTSVPAVGGCPVTP